MRLSDFKRKVNDGRPFSVKFVKRTDNTIRTMHCKIGVTEGIKGIGMSYNPKNKDLLPVFDTDKNAFRMVSIDSLIETEIDGKRFKFNTETRQFTEVKGKRKIA
jgi:hypothetical protein